MCCSQVLLLEVGGFDHLLFSMDQESRKRTIPPSILQSMVVCKMCCSQVLLKESSSREEERAAFLTGSGRGAHFGGWHESGGPSLATGKFERRVEKSCT